MPLFQGKSKKSFSKNVETEMDAGKPQAQSLAIAYNIKRKNSGKKKMAYGGKAEATGEPAYPPIKAIIGPSKDEYMSNHATDGGNPPRSTSDEDPAEDEYMADHFAYGGKAEATGEPAVPARKADDKRFPEDEYMSTDKWSKGAAPARKPDDMRPPKDEYMADHFAEGGEAEGHYGSVSDAIMAKKRRAKMMADGGQVQIDDNAREEPNHEDDLSYEALKKENYSEDAGLDHMDSPMDSNEHGHALPDADEHDGAKSMNSDFEERMADDMIDTIRRRMKAKRG